MRVKERVNSKQAFIVFIFLDESGDLGFDWRKAGTSRYFTITLLVCDAPESMKGFRTAVKRTIRHKLNAVSGRVQELKGTGTSIEVKRYFYRHAPDKGWELYSVTLNKERVNAELQTKKGKKKLYNFLARHLIDKVPLPDGLPQVNLVIDRCKNREEIKDFNRYIEQHLQGKLPLNTPLNITHEASHENPCLQAVDMFCWGIARKWRDDDREWFKEFVRRVRINDLYLPPLKKK